MQTIDTIFGDAHSRQLAKQEPRGFLRNVYLWFAGRLEIRRSRKVLRELSDAQLRDIGLTREQAGLQSDLPWWR